MDSTWWVTPEQLDEDQKKIISLPPKTNHLILGPPGSGKTNLLLLRANYLSLGPFPNIKVIVFTRTLTNFLASGASRYNFSSEKICTSIGWMLSFISEYGEKIEKINDFRKKRLVLIDKVQDIIKKSDNIPKYEVILLDEAQDYFPEEIDIFAKMGKRIFAVADPKQKIYDGKNCLGKIKELVKETSELHYHYRNGLEICAFADAIRPEAKLSASANYDEKKMPSKAKLDRIDGINEQCAQLIPQLEIQIKAYPKEYIGVLCLTGDDLKSATKILSKSQLADKMSFQNPGIDYVEFSETKPIVVSTLHSAKGLEFRGVHILEFDSICKFRERQKNVAFTGITRAKTSLNIYYSKSVPGFIEQAYAVISRPFFTPTLNDVFGRRD